MSDDFDPDKYLAEKAALAAKAKQLEPAFDPDAYLRAKGIAPVMPTTAAPAEPSRTEAFLRGASQGATLGFGDELDAGTNAVLAKLFGNSTEKKQNLGALYRATRDAERAKNDAAEQAHKGFYIGGNVVGGLPSAIAGGGEGATLKALVKSGAAIGALNGLGSSKADLTNPTLGNVAQAVGDTGLGGAIGAATGGLGYGAGKVLKSALGGLASKLETNGLNQARRVLLNGADSLSTRLPTSEAAVREALESGAIKPFGTTVGAAERLGDLRETQAGVYNNVLKELEARGVTGPNAKELADKLVNTGSELSLQEMNGALPKEYLDQALTVLGKAGPEGELGLTQAEALKRSLQKMAKYGRYEETPLNEVRRDIASTFRQSIEDAVDSQAQKAPEAAAAFVPAKQKLARLIEAGEAADRGAAKYLRRSATGLGGEIAAGMGDPVGAAKGISLSALWHALKSRGGSTVATGAYGLSKALGSAAPSVDSAASRLLMSSAGRAAEPGLLAPLAEPYLPAVFADDEEQKRRALIQALRDRNK